METLLLYSKIINNKSFLVCAGYPTTLTSSLEECMIISPFPDLVVFSFNYAPQTKDKIIFKNKDRE